MYSSSRELKLQGKQLTPNLERDRHLQGETGPEHCIAYLGQTPLGRTEAHRKIQLQVVINCLRSSVGWCDCAALRATGVQALIA